jgi:transposase-like protein
MSPVVSHKNKYAKRSKISESKFRKLIQYFASDFDAKTIADLTNLNRNTVNRYLTLIRERIAEFCMQESPLKADGEFASPLFKSKDITCLLEDQATYLKMPVFGVIQCNGKMITVIVQRTNMNSASHWTNSENTIAENDDSLNLHNKEDYLYGSENFINGIESFLSYARQRLMKFHGIPKSTFYLHLKECEFRFNYRNEDIYSILLKIIRINPLC